MVGRALAEDKRGPDAVHQLAGNDEGVAAQVGVGKRREGAAVDGDFDPEQEPPKDWLGCGSGEFLFHDREYAGPSTRAADHAYTRLKHPAVESPHKIKDQNLHDVIVENLEAIRNTNETIGKLAKSVEEKKELPNQFEAQQKTVRALERRVRVVHDARMGIEKTSESLRTRVKPSVEHYMSMFLPSVTMNRYKIVSLNEDYNLSVWDAEAGELRAREVFSGGTEDQLLLVMRLAFALALTPEAKGTRPDFLFLDEPLGSSDDIRRDEIVQLLKTELAQYFKQILLISHIQGVEQDVDHIVRLEGGRITEQM